jgi:nucleoid-associated protein YgaU
MEYKGIDVSSFQGFINWPQAADAGVDFAMTRATYGTSGIDARFRENMENIKKTNISSGAYHYCYATNTDEAVREANHFVHAIESYEIKYPAALNIEERSISKLGKQKITDIIIHFVDILKNNNLYPIIHTTEDWLENFIDINRISDIDIWLSRWTPRPGYGKNIGIWQYSNSGNVAGVGNNINMDISYRDYKNLIENKSISAALIENKSISAAKLNSNNITLPETKENNSTSDTSPSALPNALTDTKDKPEQIPPPAFLVQHKNPPVQKRNLVLYTVKPGDTLWAIAQKLLGDGRKLKKIQGLNNLPDETIHAGQTLMIPENTESGWTLHSVQRGDTLWNLSEKYLGSWARYNEIININNLYHDIIYPGQILKIPVNNDTQNHNNTSYTVKPGDTLTEIARKLLGDARKYSEIMKFNSLKTAFIKIGQKLKIPS